MQKRKKERKKVESLADQSPAFLSRGSELPDGLDEGDDESEAGIGERNRENPREGTGADPGTRDGLRHGARELHEVQGLLLNPWELLFNFHLHDSDTLFGFSSCFIVVIISAFSNWV